MFSFENSISEQLNEFRTVDSWEKRKQLRVTACAGEHMKKIGRN